MRGKDRRQGWAQDLGPEQLEGWSCLLLPFVERGHWEKEVLQG